LDPEQPRIAANLTARTRHYLGLRGVETKMRKLLRDFEFEPLSLLIEEIQQDIRVDEQYSPQALVTTGAGLSRG
jgi:Domain of unknown function (DUF3473)